MKRIVVVLIVSVSVIIAIATIGVIYHTADLAESANQFLFLDIANHTIIQQKDEPLFLSVTTSEKIPMLLGSSAGYGYAWLESDSDVLSGYTINIHSQDGAAEWHAESITISDSDRFCFDDVTVVAANVIVDGYSLNVTFDQNDTMQFDRIISYEIVNDNSCHFGMAGIIVDQLDVK